jgi:hypothetical protein
MENKLNSNLSGGGNNPRPESQSAFWVDGAAAVVATLGIAMIWSNPVSQYRAGLRNMPVDFPWVMAWGCTLLVILPTVILSYAVWTMVRWRRSGARRRAARVVLGLAMTFGAVYYPASGDMGMAHFARGFDEWSRTHVNVPAIEAWADGLHLPPDTEVPTSAWSPEIRQLQPEFVMAFDHGAVDLCWGGGFGHWGLTVTQPGRPTTQPSYHGVGTPTLWNTNVMVWW